jgi:hypothetical protein
MDRQLVHYLPVITTILAFTFSVVLFRHWWAKRQATYLFWWMLGIAVFGLGTLSEGLTTLNGWHEPIFRLWYISGALMGAVFLAQGTVYLLIEKKTADRMTAVLVVYLAIASLAVALTPIDTSLVEPYRLSGTVMAWGWVRLFSPLVNIYALFWLVGGAVWSAIRYFLRAEGTERRVVGNTAIAVGALLPAIGGAFARFGRIEVAYVTELIGLALIWVGYRVIVTDSGPSIHATQRAQVGS